jgi:hypothetical protein
VLVSELAEQADMPVATVKYYLREGLLQPGHVTGPRRAEYDESHVRRLRILRLLREVGGVPVTLLNGPGMLGADAGVLGYYAQLADQLAKTEISLINPHRERAALLEDMVTGSVVYGQVFTLLRQMGHEHHHAQLEPTD